MTTKSTKRTHPDPDGRWLTVSQSARLLGVSAQTVRKWSAAGRLPEMRTEGGHRRYDRTAIDVLIADRTSSAGIARTAGVDPALNVIIRALAEERESSFVVDLACDQLIAAMSASAATISFYDPEQNALLTLLERGEEVELAVESFVIDDYPVTSRVVHDQVCALVNLDDPDADPAECALMREYGAVSLLMTPLIFAGQTIGITEIVDKRRPRHYSEAEMERVVQLSAQVALAVHITQIIERLKKQHEQEQRRQADFELLFRTAQSIGSNDELHDMLTTTTRRVTETLGVAWSDFYEWHPEKEILEVTAYFQVPEVPVWEDWLGTTMGRESMRDWKDTVEEHKPSVSYIDDPDITEEERLLMVEYDEKATLAVPVVYAGELLGVLDVGESRWNRRYTDDEVRLLQAIADQWASALHNAREYRRRAELTTLLRVSEALTSSTDIEAMLGVVCTQLRSALDISYAEAYTFDEQTGHLICKARDGHETMTADDWDGTFSADEVPDIAAAIESQAPVITHIDDPELAPAMKKVMEVWGEMSALVVPMVHHGEVVGIVSLSEARAKRLFDGRDITLATAIASQGAVAVENARVYAQLTNQATTDGLTGLHNHRYLDEYLASEIAKAMRYGNNLSVLMLDIDDFKRFNDTFGHPQGDKLLKELAAVLLDCTRLKVDLAARYGGEEFCIVLPNTPPKDDGTPEDQTVAEGIARSGEIVAERIRSAVADRRYEGHPGRRTETVTVSIGVAAITSPKDSTDTLVADADKALYIAKNTGKNKVVVFGD